MSKELMNDYFLETWIKIYEKKIINFIYSPLIYNASINFLHFNYLMKKTTLSKIFITKK